MLLGCFGGDFQFANVEGKVTLDGEPLANALVRFNPQRSGESALVGPSSSGLTDEEGHYKLKTHEDRSGAVVGSHRVSISTYETRLVDPENSDRIEVVQKEMVPAKYRSPTELRFDLPPSGANEANFELTSN